MNTHRITRLQGTLDTLLQWAGRYQAALTGAGPGVCNFGFGNPHEMPLSAFTAALRHQSIPRDKDSFAYKANESASRAHVAHALNARYGMAFAPQHISMTHGAAGALQLAFYALLDPGDEVIINLPPWFFYESYIQSVGGRAVKVRVRDDFDLDVPAIAAAITPRTRAVVVNSPNNPTGRIYPDATLHALADVLNAASAEQGRPVYLISDEAYSRILLDGRTFMTPTAFYPQSLLIYTYAKTLLTPGQRLGYIALSPNMPERDALQGAIEIAQYVNGYAFADALMQASLPELEPLCIDLEAIQARRDHMAGALQRMGYTVSLPEGTFYLLVKSPLADDLRFVDMLAAQGVLCLPGTVCEVPGWFRISLTANDDMITRALPVFELLSVMRNE